MKSKPKKVSKKVSKKETKTKKRVVKKTTQELRITVVPQPIVPTVEELSQPLTTSGKKIALAKTWVNSIQLMNLVMRTPKEHVYSRPGKGGQKFSYVTGNYVEKVLNFVFGWNWDFEVVEHGQTGDFIWVHGKLTVKSPDGKQTITKSQFGRAEVKYLRNVTHKPENMVDFGNDLKAASTDALKKCASLLGIASDVYGKSEYKSETGKDPIEPKEPSANTDTVPGPDGEPVFTCAIGDEIVTPQEAAFSKKVFGKVLCREHQAEAKRKK